MKDNEIETKTGRQRQRSRDPGRSRLAVRIQDTGRTPPRCCRPGLLKKSLLVTCIKDGKVIGVGTTSVGER